MLSRMLNPQSRPNNIREYVIGNVVTELRKDRERVVQLERQIVTLQLNLDIAHADYEVLRDLYKRRPYIPTTAPELSIIEKMGIATFYVCGVFFTGQLLGKIGSRLELSDFSHNSAAFILSTCVGSLTTSLLYKLGVV